MLNYLIGILKNFPRRNISLFSIIDNKSLISNNARIYRQVKIVSSQISDYTYVAPNSEIVFAHIGKFCSIGPNVKVGLAFHPSNRISTSPFFYSKSNALGISIAYANSFNEFKETFVGNDVWIGANSIILGGVTIGDGAIIAAGAVVTKDVTPYSIVGGVPAKLIKMRFSDETIMRVQSMKWWNLSVLDLKDKIDLFNKELL